MLETELTSCPYCDERIELLVDLSAGSASYVEDCPVCCQPILVHLVSDTHDPDDDNSAWHVRVERENG
ncbi:MAG: CPXCG motif-containing cysteine-rich protein [Gammaproteobacteria bacterium]|nr:CPXCG motif-containing cysteine-rich protein [Gammaproteobacteria bacterium]